MADQKQQDAAASIGTVEAGDFESLLRKEFKPRTDEAKEAVEQAVRTLAEQALSQTKLIGISPKRVLLSAYFLGQLFSWHCLNNPGRQLSDVVRLVRLPANWLNVHVF
jgi:hypothetical protein